MNREMTSSELRARYRTPLWSVPDPRLRRSLGLSTGLGLLVLAVVLLAPARVAPPARVEQVPERLAQLILKERKAPPVLAPAPSRVEAPKPVEPEVQPRTEEAPAPAPRAEPAPLRRTPREQPTLPEDRGALGREKARTEVAAALESTTKSVEATLQSLSSDLATIRGGDASEVPSRRRGAGRPGHGRSAGEVAGAVAARGDVGAGAAVGTVVTGALIDIESLVPVGGGSGGDLASNDPDAVAGGAAGSYRSNASLLAVVRKYAAGIQFCYDNELQRQPGIEGKMVVVLTVLASGRVAEATIAQDSLGSAGLRECVLAQVREWKFPAIPEGTVTFRSPFVFTPPN